jgi:flagellar biosynthesis protein FlhF
MQKLGDCELVLIDTAGRSPKDDAQICELEKMLAAAEPDETHLVLSCSQSANAMVKTANRFARANFSHLLLTKLDEALALGPILSLSRAVERPISYVTTGQNVPDDIEIAESGVLVERMVSTDSNQNGEAKYVA